MPSTPERPYLELLPAVDIKGGQAVQLVQGVDGSEKRFGDPVLKSRATEVDRFDDSLRKQVARMAGR